MEQSKTMTCWRDPNLHIAVNAFSKKEPPLDQVKHGIVLKSLFEMIPKDRKAVIDIGCGNAKASKIIGDREYTGLDLPNTIQTISIPNNSDVQYIPIDTAETNFRFLRLYDIVLMNAFIDVMHYPLGTLHRILRCCMDYVVLHRQEIHESPTIVVQNPSYTGFTHHSIINRKMLFNLFTMTYFNVVTEVDSGHGGNWRSFVLCKKR